ncbi:MAG: CpaF family protein, partial [Chloroflexota bacterium]
MSLLKRIENNQEQPKGENRASKLQELRVKRTSPATGSRDAFVDLKNRIQQKLIAELDPSIDITQTSEVRSTIQEMFETMLVEEQIVLSRNEKRVLFEQIVAEILGFGPLEKFLNVDGVTEIMVNGPKQVYIERDGKLQRVSTTFEDDEHLLRIIDRIVAPLGRRIDEGAPMVDARLPDGSRVNAVIPPISINGPTLTIRLFSKIPLTIENLIEFGSITPEAVEFLKACILARLNLVVSGGTGSGKTTLLNILSNFIPDTDRIVTIENAAELQLRQEHVVTLE